MVHKPGSFQTSPKVPNFDNDAKKAVLHEGLPPLEAQKAASGTVVFTHVKNLFTRAPNAEGVQMVSTWEEDAFGMVVVRDGVVVCSSSDCVAGVDKEATFIDLEGGAISPGLVTFGAPMGLEHITQEPSTVDGSVYDPLVKNVPKILGNGPIVRAVDGLLFASRDALCVRSLYLMVHTRHIIHTV